MIKFMFYTKDEEMAKYLEERAEIENMTVKELVFALIDRQMHKDKIKKEISML